ncbi:MAG TPA: L,D-transpeptidase family protein [Cellvibrio sp.]|nr:L,D-transpeptidase family protein [Cellvibrio sp.]
MLELRCWLARLVSLQGVLVFCLGLGAASAQAWGDKPSAKDQPDVAALMATEIEAQMVALQLEVAEGRKTTRHRLPEALIGFYAQREYRPIWDRSERLEQLIGSLETLEADGLTPDDYYVKQLRLALPLLGSNSPADVPTRVADELRATNAYLYALYHLYNGKVDPAGLDSHWNFDPHDMSPIADSARIAESVESGQIPQLFEKIRPQHVIYRSFKAGLVHYRLLAAQGGWPSLPAGPTLKPCMVDPVVAILRQRLQITGEYSPPALLDAAGLSPAQKCLGTTSLATSSAGLIESTSDDATTDNVVTTNNDAAGSDNTALVVAASSASSAPAIDPNQVFDEYLVEAVKRFQREQYLEVDGAIGPATRAALNISVQSRIDQIRVNLDRARWLLHNIPNDMVLVDVAGFKITYVKAGLPVWRSRVQVGMAYRTSPIFKSEINYITLNPTWTVPPTILRKDVLPKIRKDVGYLHKNRMRVLDSSGKEINPANVNWSSPGNVTIRQDAGEGAALGKAVIRFPNSYAVYLHDTPHQKLFDKSQRAFSSGCIRVERALELVELLLADTPSWDADAINTALAAGKTRNVTLAKRVPILLAYWTVDALSETQIAFKPDIYARDAAVLAALNRSN